MKHRGSSMATLLAGVLVGLALAGPVANAATEYFQAQRTPHPIYVDGRQTEMETYAINGHNYVKLRDVGQAVDFNVYYDGGRNAAILEPDKPYTGEDVGTPTPSPKPGEDVDHAAQANSAIFRGDLSRENYNAIRDTVLHREEVAAGQYQPIPLGEFTRNGIIDEVATAIGGYPVYEIVSRPGGDYVCNAKYPSAYAGAAEHTQGFINGLAGRSDREKVTAITWYVADRITYAVQYPGPGEVLAQDGQVPGACMAYAYSFLFLCDRTGIPCILKRGGNHQWNMVYVDGQWWDVDVTAADAGDDASIREYVTILNDPVAHEQAGFIDEEPAVTAFAKELLVPGSTK